MMKVFIQNNRIEDARDLFDEMPEKTSFSWNSMIMGLQRRKKDTCCIETLRCDALSVGQLLLLAYVKLHGSIQQALQIFMVHCRQFHHKAWSKKRNRRRLVRSPLRSHTQRCKKSYDEKRNDYSASKLGKHACKSYCDMSVGSHAAFTNLVYVL